MWEYEVVALGPQNQFGGRSGPGGVQEMLNDRARQGWELVATAPAVEMSNGQMWVFKRPAEASIAQAAAPHPATSADGEVSGSGS